MNATWDCADTQGNAYCVNSSRDAYIRTDGAIKTWFTSPLGTMVDATPTRMVVSGVSGTPNTIYFSEDGIFTNYTVGINETSPFSEVIASPGSKITHIRYGCGKVLWWKDQSFGYLNGDNQFNLSNTIVSDNIGTFDNTSALDPGGSVWFRGQDGHIWKYDCTALTKESIEISPLIQTAGKRVSNFWTQNTQADFDAGRISPNAPSLSLSTASISGSIVVSSFVAVDTSSTQFVQGYGTNVTISTFSVSLSTNNAGSITDNDLEGTYATNFTGGVFRFATCDGVCGTGGQSATQWAENVNNGNCGGVCGGTCANDSPTVSSLQFSILDTNGIGLSTTTLTISQSCTWTQQVVTQPSLAGRRVKYRWTYNNLASGMTTNSTYMFPGTVSFYYRCPDTAGLSMRCNFDSVSGGSSTITSGNFTSRTFDTALDSTTAKILTSWSVDSTTPTIEMQHATSASGPWSPITTSSGTDVRARRYIRYVSSFTLGSANYLPAFTSATIMATSSGTYYSDVHNAPNLASWDTFGANQSLNDGTLTYFTRSSTNPFTVLSATPTWVSQSNGSVVSASTGTYFQARIYFGVTSATQTPTVNEFSFNWFEGSASDQAYGTYFDNAIWFSVASGVGISTNNYVFRYDLINQGWTLYNFGSGGFAIQNNRLYFGGVGIDNIFKYGETTSDNGAAIQSYWKTKDFSGADPFLENQYTQFDSIWSRDTNQTVNVSYSLDTSTASTSYSVVLSSPTQTIIRNKKLLPNGKNGGLLNIQFGETSTSGSWELMGYRFRYTVLPYRPTQ